MNKPHASSTRTVPPAALAPAAPPASTVPAAPPASTVPAAPPAALAPTAQSAALAPPALIAPDQLAQVPPERAAASPAVSAQPPSTSTSADPRHILGMRGEDAVAEQLTQWGWVIIDRNWRCRIGELDIVARDGDTLAFVEVKTRTSTNFGHPAEAISRTKTARLYRLIGQWLHTHPAHRYPNIRLDVAALVVQEDSFRCEYFAGVDR